MTLNRIRIENDKLLFIALIALTSHLFASELTLRMKSLDKPSVSTSECYWTDHLIGDPEWVGIALDSKFTITNSRGSYEASILFFLPSCKGVGHYSLAGTKDNRWSAANNLPFCGGNCYWVSIEEYTSEVVITKFEDNKISGTYHALVYYSGRKNDNDVIEVSGTFTDVEKTKK